VAAEYEVNIKLNTQQIERELKKVDKAVKDIGKAKGGSRASGLGLMPNDELKRLQQSRIYLGQSVQSIDRLAKIQDRRARSLNKINELESKGLNVHRLRRQLVKATTEQSKRRLGSAEKEFRILEKNLRLEQSKLRILREQQKGFPSSPIRGARTMMGSPAQIAASGRQRVSPIGGRIDIAGSPAQMQAIRQLEMAEIRADKNAHFAELKLIQKRQKIQLDNVDKLFRANERELEKFNRKLEAADKARQKRLAGAPIPGLGGRTFGPSRAFAGPFASPVGGTEGTPGSPAFNRALELGRFRSSPIGGATNIAGSPAARRVRRQRLEQVGLGAGFPLLFGGGAGSVIGGGLGGLTGSFGAQIAFSAIGQQIDQFIASVANVGTALTSASGTVEMFREKNLFSSDAVKKHAFELEQQGEMQKLATLLTKDLASQIGVNAVKNFQELGGEVKEFLGTINQLFLAVQGFVAGPLAKLLGAINTVLGGVSTDVQFGSLRGSLTGEAAAQFEAIVAETRGTKALTGPARQRALRQGAPLTKEGRLTTAVKEAVLKDPRVAKLRQTLDVTGQTTLDDTLGGNTAVKTAQRLLESSQRRISILKLETEEIKKITDFKNKIAAAELVGDKRAVARLTRDQELAELKSNEDKAIARINPKLTEAQKALEKTNIEARGLAQAAEIRAQFERDIAAIVKDEQNEAYKQQAKLLKANFDLQQKELKKAQDLAKSFGDTVKDGFVDSIKAATDETQRLSDALANMLNRLSDQLLNLAANLAFYGNAQGSLQQGQGLFGTLLGSVASIFNPFASLMAPGGRYEGQSGPLAPTPPPLPALANGGIAMAGQAHIVGERGPELFVPRRTGTVVPNHAMGGANVTVNVDASGSSVEGNADQASQLGKAIGIAVQQELVKQKRPGGLLARSR
jgi:hypothetical protein